MLRKILREVQNERRDVLRVRILPINVDARSHTTRDTKQYYGVVMGSS